jgi:glucose/arabinose dehydrogenase
VQGHVFQSTRGRRLLLSVVMGSQLGLVLLSPHASATVPAGFTDTAVITGRTHPTSVSFAPNGQIFVTEKSGEIWSYNSLSDTAPTLVADLRTQVDNYVDRGLLGLAVPPNYPTDNHLYVLYTYDAPIGGTAPTWNDSCPNPPGATTDGCVVSGRLSRLTLSGGVSTSEQVLINDWCQQFPSHSIGTVAFGADGYLYAGGGSGAKWSSTDYGQFGATNPGDQANPCGDPPGGVGTALTPPTAEGGSLRSQSPRRTNGPTSLDGAILRLDPATGLGAPGNPYAGSPDANKARILAYGLRNPFRFTMRPGTREVWIGDVGESTWEEIDRVTDTSAGVAQNFGWPCYEGTPAQPGFQSAGLDQCTSLYNTPGSVTPPYYAYNHGASVVSGDGCSTGGSSITGVAFYPGGQYPSAYKGALFFGDHTRKCIWAMMPDANGDPDPNNIVPFTPAANPVDLKIGPNNDLFYVDLDGGTIHRVTYTAGNQPPNHGNLVSMVFGPNHEDVITLGNDGNVWYMYWSGTAWWPSWTSIGAPPIGLATTSSISAVSMQSGLEDIYAIGKDGHIYYRHWNGSSWFPSWTDLSAPPAGLNPSSALATVTMATGTQDVYATDVNGKVWYRYWSGTAWSAWTGLAAPGVGVKSGSNLTAVSMSHGTQDIYAVGADGNVWYRYWTGSVWSAWTNSGKPSVGIGASGVISASTMTPGTEDVYVIGTDGHVWYQYWDGSRWSAWVSGVGAPPAGLSPSNSALSVVSVVPGQENVAAVGNDNSVWLTYWTGSAWASWSNVIGAPPGGIA